MSCTLIIKHCQVIGWSVYWRWVQRRERKVPWGGSHLYHQGWFLCTGDIWTKTQKEEWNWPHLQEGAECIKKGNIFKCRRYCKIGCNMNAINMQQNIVKMEVSKWWIRQVLGLKQWKWLLWYKCILTHSCIENLTLNWTVLRSIGFEEICGSQGLHPHS